MPLTCPYNASDIFELEQRIEARLDGLIRETTLAKLAGESFSYITGVNLEKQQLLVDEALTIAMANHVITLAIPLVLMMPEPQTNIEHIAPQLLIDNLINYGELPVSPELVYRTYTGRTDGWIWHFVIFTN